MARRIGSLDDVRVDIFQALKRGLMYRGFMSLKDHEPSKSRDETEEEQNQPISEAKFEKSESKKSNSQEASENSEEDEPGEIHEKLIDLTEKAQDVLFTADTVFPFTFFPDTITLDREKLTVVERFFFRVAKIITVPISSMISAEANVGPFFGSVQMTSKYFINNTHIVKFLRRDQAEEIHRLLQGFIIAQEKDIDVSEVDKEDLKVLLNDLGKGTRE